MNTNNLEYLKDGLKYTGFGDKLHEELERNVKMQAPAFQLRLQTPYNNNTMDYTLHFRKSDQADMYFFNKYEATLKTPNPEQDKSQTFYMNKNSGITAREAYNLLNGRSVHKELLNAEGQPYKAWLQLDPNAKDMQGNHKIRQFHENYGFDLEKTLKQFPIKELHDPQQKEQLLQRLKKGNLYPVTVQQDGKEVTRFLEASPKFKTINVYDEQLHKVKRETLLRQEVRPTVRQEQQAQQPKVKQDTSLKQEPETRRTRKKGMGM
ncbi:hypothetical protein ACSX1A_11250 [Pontibacter sp. MBLB2868]|uniref:hypothetical protein n=1 Tax=Pontibacter sp. MBLB2868 TaxID=3451555 RepID=UPI003F750C34